MAEESNSGRLRPPVLYYCDKSVELIEKESIGIYVVI